MGTNTMKLAFVETANFRENAPFALLAGGLAFLNTLLLPSMAILAFWVGAIIGTLIFIRQWKISRSRGVGYLIVAAGWCYAMQSAGVIEPFHTALLG